MRLSCPPVVRRFARDRRANLSTVLALSLVPMLGMGGLAIDYTVAQSAKAQFDTAADAAALAAINAAKSALASSNPLTIAGATSAGQAAGVAAFSANSKTVKNGAVSASTVNVQQSGLILTASVTYAGSSGTSLSSVLGFPTFGLHGQATATYKLAGYMQVYLLVDVSGSMSIGASTADINKMMANYIDQGEGCAFACHDGNPVWVNGRNYNDAQDYALSNGITLRFQVINQGILALMNYLNTIDPTQTRIRMQVSAFADSINTVVPMTNNRSAINASSLPSPVLVNGSSGTPFNQIIGNFVTSVGASGDGSSPTAAAKLVIVATDGVQDPGLARRSWPDLQSIGPFDITFCRTLQSNGVSVGIINTPFLPLPSNGFYNGTLGQSDVPGFSGTRDDYIPVQMKNCAGSLFVQASDSTSIVSSFTSIFQTFQSARLTK